MYLFNIISLLPTNIFFHIYVNFPSTAIDYIGSANLLLLVNFQRLREICDFRDCTQYLDILGVNVNVMVIVTMIELNGLLHQYYESSTIEILFIVWLPPFSFSMFFT
ncbi:hypothetical protein ACJX0J_008815, partial [Zea mays]